MYFLELRCTAANCIDQKERMDKSQQYGITVLHPTMLESSNVEEQRRLIFESVYLSCFVDEEYLLRPI